MLNQESKPLQGTVYGQGRYQTWIPPRPLSHWVHYFWHLTVPVGEYWYRSVPDNCVDLIFNLDDLRDAVAISLFTQPILYPLKGPVSYFGVRFRVFGQQAFLSDPVGEWTSASHQLPVRDLFSEALLNELQDSFLEYSNLETLNVSIARVMLKYVERPIIDPRVLRFACYCYQPNRSLDLKTIASRELGITDRQLRRLSQQYLGLSPKAFSKVLRFQNTLKAWNTEQDTMAWAEWYFDQSHFSREFKSLTGVTPNKFAKMSVLYNMDVTK